MTASRYVTIWCDGAGCQTWTGGDSVRASDARRSARAEGWRVGLPGGKDLCPDCHRPDIEDLALRVRLA